MSSPITSGQGRRRSSSGAAEVPPAAVAAAVAASRRAFYRDAAAQLSSGSVPLSSPYDFEISKLFAPAMVAGLLEPVQMTAESICVGRLGVAQLGALGLGTVLFQFAVGFFAPLAVNNLSALLPTLVATSLATGLGVQHLGAHTILRQLMGFWLQLFLAFNATAHSLVANSLSRRAEGRAAEVLARLAQLAVALSIPVAVALFVGRGLLPDLFTEDVLVRHEVADVLPLLLLIMPLDALGTVLEGGILGASDTGYLGARTAASCGISLLVLIGSFFLHGSLLSVWLGMKAINVTALALDLARFLWQPKSEGTAEQAGSPAAPPSKEHQK